MPRFGKRTPHKNSWRQHSGDHIKKRAKMGIRKKPSFFEIEQNNHRKNSGLYSSFQLQSRRCNFEKNQHRMPKSANCHGGVSKSQSKNDRKRKSYWRSIFFRRKPKKTV